MESGKWAFMSTKVTFSLKRRYKQYQEEYMVPAQTNNNVAIHTVNEVVHAIPEAFGMKAFMKRVIFCTVEEPVRVAMM